MDYPEDSKGVNVTSMCTILWVCAIIAAFVGIAMPRYPEDKLVSRSHLLAMARTSPPVVVALHALRNTTVVQR
jgi:hypothetical protein